MIRVVKPAPPPVLMTRGATAAKEHCDEFDASPAGYRSGAKTFTFKADIYAAAEVKDTLLAAQHGKCAFCESYFTHTGYGDVEHYRPKAGYKQKTTDDLKRPGYYWLAYEWANLFCSCQLCNQRFKRNLFPLKDGRRCARSHTHDLGKEEPLLVDPAGDPSAFIAFRRQYAYPVGGCPEGEATITEIGLNRPELVEIRGKRLEDVETLVKVCRLLRQAARDDPSPANVAELRDYEARLHAKWQDSGEYAAMIQGFLGK